MKHALILLLISVSFLSVKAQTFRLDKAASTLTISGTSSLHDWEVEAEDMSGSASMSVSGREVSIQQLSFSVPAKELKSGKNAMDKKTFDALKGSDHPNIKYTIESVTTGSGKITANGHLELAGVRKSVSVQANASPSGSNAINFEGTVDLKMTDFDMEPPRALLGTLKTGDDIVVHYNLTYKSN